MAGELPFYTEIDGTWHTIGEGEVTLCGLRLPYPGAKWQRSVPDGLHCGDDDPLVKLAQGEEPENVPEGKTVAEAAAMEAVAPPKKTAKAKAKK